MRPRSVVLLGFLFFVNIFANARDLLSLSGAATNTTNAHTLISLSVPASSDSQGKCVFRAASPLSGSGLSSIEAFNDAERIISAGKLNETGFAGTRGLDYPNSPELHQSSNCSLHFGPTAALLRSGDVLTKSDFAIAVPPDAPIYLDETLKSQACPQRRVVIENPKPGDHSLQVSLAGKKGYEHPITVVAGLTSSIGARPENLGPTPGQTGENPKDGLKYVWIPPGTFMMGCSTGDNECVDDEKPAHQVTISRGFWIGQTLVTVRAYKRFAVATGRSMPPEPDILGRALNPAWGNDAMPIVDVNWGDAQAYCGWAGGRLPTEAEWEYAARGGSTEARYGPLDEVAWYANNSGAQPLDSWRIFNGDPKNYLQRLKDNGNAIHEVGLKRPNAFGLYDVLGNVWEWVHDWYDQNYYRSSPSQDPQGPAGGQLRVLRGGAWVIFPMTVRASSRLRHNPTVGTYTYGIRCGVEAGNI